ncbi:MAG: DUF2851 family protein [Prevotellaceae bacterium]|jgi:hypothetical protein|nr:DUF2851 family protein [Prevotellaceae bacterium]
MKENLLQYVWQYGLFAMESLKTTTGEAVEIIDRGKKNTDAGPDFFNAKIKIGKTLWAGNVEIHLTSADWNRHNHHKDKSYNSVILHVVEKANRPVYRQTGEEIPQLEIAIREEIRERHKVLLSSGEWIRCESFWKQLSPECIKLHLHQLLNERFMRKTDAILMHLTQNNNNWEETFYVFLTRNFGMNINSLPFEMLAKSLPLACLGKHKDNLAQIEALLFGQAGLLSGETNDEYFRFLQKEYLFLRQKFSLSPIDSSLWKFAKMRPVNFPTIRIAQFAMLIHRSSKLFSRLMETGDLTKLHHFFRYGTSAYWENHYTFGEISPKRKKVIGEESINILLINTVSPFLFAFSIKKDCPEILERAYSLLEKIAPEQNSIIEKWEQLGVNAENAYDTQALLELKKQYCNEKKCLQCGIGYQLLSSRKSS